MIVRDIEIWLDLDDTPRELHINNVDKSKYLTPMDLDKRIANIRSNMIMMGQEGVLVLYREYQEPEVLPMP